MHCSLFKIVLFRGAVKLTRLFLLWKTYPVANSNDQCTPEALALIDRYADKKYVLDELGASLDSFASVGSIVPYYERRRNIYSTLLKHKNESVRRWAQRQINSCDYMIQRESTLEQEKW